MKKVGIIRYRLSGFFLWLIIGISVAGCAHQSPQNEAARNNADLEKAIKVIRERRDYEYEIIREEKYAISILEENIGKAHSEGMKQKLRDEITLKKAVITKAEKNIDNQNTILGELGLKLDSLKNL